jgi:hypothetical protein
MLGLIRFVDLAHARLRAAVKPKEYFEVLSSKVIMLLRPICVNVILVREVTQPGPIET